MIGLDDRLDDISVLSDPMTKSIFSNKSSFNKFSWLVKVTLFSGVSVRFGRWSCTDCTPSWHMACARHVCRPVRNNRKNATDSW